MQAAVVLRRPFRPPLPNAPAVSEVGGAHGAALMAWLLMPRGSTQAARACHGSGAVRGAICIMLALLHASGMPDACVP